MDLVDPETGWYQRSYFAQRLDDEVARAVDHDRQVALVYFRLPLGAWEFTHHLRIYLTLRLGLMGRELGDDAGFSGRISEDEFAICLADVSDSKGDGVLALLWSTLSGLGADAVVLTCPEDGTDAAALMEAAGAKLRPLNVVNLEEYRARRYGKAA